MIKIIIQALAFLTLISDIFLVLIVIFFLAEKMLKFKLFSQLIKILIPKSWHLLFAVTLLATLGSLFFSEVAKFTPCTLCWYQRIFMYPQPLIVYLAFIREEIIIKPYLLLLNVVGIILSAYHNFIQIFPKASILNCEAGVPCTKIYHLYFGYISIPVMSLTAFLLATVLLLISKSQKHR